MDDWDRVHLAWRGMVLQLHTFHLCYLVHLSHLIYPFTFAIHLNGQFVLHYICIKSHYHCSHCFPGGEQFLLFQGGLVIYVFFLGVWVKFQSLACQAQSSRLSRSECSKLILLFVLGILAWLCYFPKFLSHSVKESNVKNRNTVFGKLLSFLFWA